MKTQNLVHIAVGSLLLAMAACAGQQERILGPGSVAADTRFITDVIEAAEGPGYLGRFDNSGGADRLSVWTSADTLAQNIFSLNFLDTSRVREARLVLSQVTPHWLIPGSNEPTFKLYIKLDGQVYSFQQSQVQWGRQSVKIHMYSPSLGHSIVLHTMNLGQYRYSLAKAAGFLIYDAAENYRIGHISTLARYQIN